MSDAPTGDPTTGPSRSVPDAAAGATPVRLERRVLRLWRIRAAIVIGVVAVLAGAGTAVWSPVAGAIALVAVGGVLGALAWWWTGLAWARWSFTLSDQALALSHGVLVRRTSTVPYHRVQLIDFEAGPIERRLGLTTMRLRTAAATTDGSVPGIDADDATALRAQILARIGTTDAV